MIKDILKNYELYLGINPYFPNAFKFLNEIKNIDRMEMGRIEIDGDNVFALVQEYQTRDFNPDSWEAHKKYFDIQYIVSGVERICVEDIDNMSNLTDYHEENDYWLFKNTRSDSLLVNTNHFVILGPRDVHQPGVKNIDSRFVKKIVIKVKVI